MAGRYRGNHGASDLDSKFKMLPTERRKNSLADSNEGFKMDREGQIGGQTVTDMQGFVFIDIFLKIAFILHQRAV